MKVKDAGTAGKDILEYILSLTKHFFKVFDRPVYNCKI